MTAIGMGIGGFLFACIALAGLTAILLRFSSAGIRLGAKIPIAIDCGPRVRFVPRGLSYACRRPKLFMESGLAASGVQKGESEPERF
jgi:hypothetical protein